MHIHFTLDQLSLFSSSPALPQQREHLLGTKHPAEASQPTSQPASSINNQQQWTPYSSSAPVAKSNSSYHLPGSEGEATSSSPSAIVAIPPNSYTNSTWPYPSTLSLPGATPAGTPPTRPPTLPPSPSPSPKAPRPAATPPLARSTA